MAVAQRVDGDAGEQVPVLAAVGVDQSRAAPEPRMKGRAGVRRGHVRPLPRFDGGGSLKRRQGRFLPGRRRARPRADRGPR